MVIEYVDGGSILDDPANILVDPVCCVPGVMGAGLAKAFADRWPGLRAAHRRAAASRWPGLKAIYREATASGMLYPGQGHLVWLTGDPSRPDPFGVYLLPTKDDWREPSRIKWVRDGLAAMGRDLADAADPRWGERAVRSVAIPALGAGLGGLPWPAVHREIATFCHAYPAMDWRVYGPRITR